MKKTILKSMAIAFVGAMLTVSSAYAIPTSSDYFARTDFTTGTDGEVTAFAINFYVTDFVGTFGLYSLMDLADPSSAISRLDVITYPTTTFLQSVWFDIDSTGQTWASLDQNWAYGAVGSNDVALGDTFGFYFGDTTVSPTSYVYTDSRLNGLGVGDPIAVELNGTLENPGNVATITLTGRDLNPIVAVADVAPVPEPATMLLLGTGLAGIAGVSRRRKAQK